MASRNVTMGFAIVALLLASGVAGASQTGQLVFECKLERDLRGTAYLEMDGKNVSIPFEGFAGDVRTFVLTTAAEDHDHRFRVRIDNGSAPFVALAGTTGSLGKGVQVEALDPAQCDPSDRALIVRTGTLAADTKLTAILNEAGTYQLEICLDMDGDGSLEPDECRLERVDGSETATMQAHFDGVPLEVDLRMRARLPDGGIEASAEAEWSIGSGNPELRIRQDLDGDGVQQVRGFRFAAETAPDGRQTVFARDDLLAPDETEPIRGGTDGVSGCASADTADCADGDSRHHRGGETEGGLETDAAGADRAASQIDSSTDHSMGTVAKDAIAWSDLGWLWALVVAGLVLAGLWLLRERSRSTTPWRLTQEEGRPMTLPEVVARRRVTVQTETDRGPYRFTFEALPGGAAVVEVAAASGPVEVGGKPARAGTRHPLRSATRIRFGDAALRFAPATERRARGNTPSMTPTRTGTRDGGAAA